MSADSTNVTSSLEASIGGDRSGAGGEDFEGERRMARILYAVSILSGAAALVYQVAWTKLLAVSFGAGLLAASAVVAGFMGGMGLGAWMYHLVQARTSSALRIYAGLELGIALTAVGVTAVMWELPDAFAAISLVVPDGTPIDVVRVVTVLMLLLLPAAMMGATYPALCSALIRSRSGAERHLGLLYGWNTLGAAVGALLTGLLLLELLGLRATIGAAVITNTILAGFALLLSRREAGRGLETAPTGDEALPTTLPLGVTAAVLFFSGFSTLAYEIMWFRALRYLVGNSTYAISVVLFVFLAGLGLGSLLYPGAARKNPERNLALCQLGIAIFALVAISLEQGILAQPELRDQLSVFGENVHGYSWWMRLIIAACVAIAMLLPAVLCMGLSFPLASRLFLGSVDRLGVRIGGAVLLANLGSILGSIGAALVILPRLGTVNGCRMVAALNLMLGLTVLAAVDEPRRKRAVWAVVATTLVLLLAVEQAPRLGFVGGGPGGTLLFEEEGELSTVQVWSNPVDPAHRAMAIDGTVIGVSDGWYAPLYAKQRLLAQLPMALDAEIGRTLNVGLGSGSTLEALATHREVDSLDVVEINGGVVRGAAFFEEAAVFEDPRVGIYVEDALYHLLRTREPYDLIIADGKQNDDFSGNARVLSLEFYERSLSHLGDQGLFVQWLPLDTKASDFRIVVRTFVSVFPEVELFFYFPGSVILVGSRAPIADRTRMDEARFRDSGVGADVARIGIASRASLYALWMASREDLLAAVGPGQLNDWNHLPIEWSAYRNVRFRDGQRVDPSPSENFALLYGAALQARRRPPLFGRDHEGAALEARRLLRDSWMADLNDQPEVAVQLACRAHELVPADARIGSYCEMFRARERKDESRL